MMKECTKHHSLAHLVSGAGLAFLVVFLLPTITPYLLALGLILLVGGMLWDFASNPAKK